MKNTLAAITLICLSFAFSSNLAAQSKTPEAAAHAGGDGRHGPHRPELRAD